MYLSYIHKLLILLVITNIAAVYYWDKKVKNKAKIVQLKKELKVWMDREIRNMCKIVVFLNDEHIISMPVLPICTIDEELFKLNCKTSLQAAKGSIEESMKKGYFNLNHVYIPLQKVIKAEVRSVEIAK